MKFTSFGFLVLFSLAGSAGLQGTEPLHLGFTYQGILTDANLPAEGPYDMIFSVYGEAFAGVLLTDALLMDNVAVAGGVFSVELTFSPAIFTGQQVWLEIEVRPGASVDPADFALLGPRQKITPAPYALYALSAGTVRRGADSLTIGTLDPSGYIKLGHVAFNYRFSDSPAVTVTGIFATGGVPVAVIPHVGDITIDGFDLYLYNPTTATFEDQAYAFNWIAAGNSSLVQSWYKDLDLDGYSDGQYVDSYDTPAGYFAGSDLTGTSGDFNDDDGTINPGATEIWYDGIDQNCDGLSDYDQDMDGYDSDAFGGDDCDDLDSTVHPGAVEIPLDGIDQDCVGGDLLVLPVDYLAAGDLVITEIMENPDAVLDADGEWFEIYNASGSDVELLGLEIWNEVGLQHTVSTSLLVASGGYVVLGANADTGSNGGVSLDYSYGSSVPLSNSSASLILSVSGLDIDTVAWDNGATFPDPTGASMSLDPTQADATLNDSGSAWCEASSAYGAGDLGTPGFVNNYCGPVPLAVGDLTPGDLVITEIMQNPNAVSDAAGEWFEVYIGTDSNVDLNGLEIRDQNGLLHTVSTLWVVASGDYVVFGANADTGTNGGVSLDYSYGANVPLSNGAGTLKLAYNSIVFDSVAYDGSPSFPDPDGASMSLDPGKLNAVFNDSGSFWCEATGLYGSGDFGTPGAVNDPCGPLPLSVADLSPGDLVITEIMQNPSAVPDADGEWFEVYNASGLEVDLVGLEIWDAVSLRHTVATSLIVASEDYVVFAANADTGSNGGVSLDYNYGGSVPLSNAAGTIALSYNSVTIDSVAYDGGPSYPDPDGASMSLSPGIFDAVWNDSGGFWCSSTSPYGLGDLGTPGATNDFCGP